MRGFGGHNLLVYAANVVGASWWSFTAESAESAEIPMAVELMHRRGRLHPAMRKSGACRGPRACATNAWAA